MDMNYAEGLHLQALIATGFVLLVLVLLLNALIAAINRRKKPLDKKTALKPRDGGGQSGAAPVFKNTGALCRGLKYAAVVVACIVALCLVFLIGFVFVKGVGHISFDLLFGESGNDKMTLRPAFVSTGMLIALALVVALPIGVATAVYLAGYLDQGSSFAVMMWMFAGEGMYVDSAYATACILMIFVALLNLLVTLCERKFRKKQGIAK